MKQYGLIGFPLSHSFSKKYFTEKFKSENIADSEYELYPVEHIKHLPHLLDQHPTLCGINVTVPHKINVIKYLDRVDPNALKVGAVNCIRVYQGSPAEDALPGKVAVKSQGFWLEGFNTDIYGFEMSLRPVLKAHHNNALILGDGGSAKAVKCALEKLEIPYQSVTRKASPGSMLFSELTHTDIKKHTLIINTTPLGTSPNVLEYAPIPYAAITDQHLLYDLIYNPEKTLFLEKGEQQGATIKNGYEMLILQAEKSWEIWTNEGKHP